MWLFTWKIKVLCYDRMISIEKWTRFEGKSSCLYQDTNKHLALGPEIKHYGIYQGNRYCSSGQLWEPNNTDHSTARFSLANIRTYLTLTIRPPDSAWPTFGPIWHWPLDRQIQYGQSTDSYTDHSTARFSLANIRTYLTLTTRPPDSVWSKCGLIHWPLDSQIQPGQHSDPSDTDHSTARFSMANIWTHTLTTWQPDSAWPTFGPIWHWPLDGQIQPGQHMDPYTDHLTARFMLRQVYQLQAIFGCVHWNKIDRLSQLTECYPT